MELKSSAFEAGGMIPKPYTCDGQDASPPLSWSDVPNGAKSLALIADDPDAPMGTWVHWVAWNIPDRKSVV
jgi:Raf kinase inhibitor-like YbhB/YbcL family protein